MLQQLGRDGDDGQDFAVAIIHYVIWMYHPLSTNNVVGYLYILWSDEIEYLKGEVILRKDLL